MKPVDILDARKRQDQLSFADTGFALLTLDQPTATTEWRKADNVKLFQEEIRPKILALFPEATRLEFTTTVVRGGKALGDQPAAVDGPHLDYYSSDVARREFHEKYPVNEAVKEHLALLGKWDTDTEEMKVLIGIWKPIYMPNNPIYDHPLAMMDARTFSPEQERPNPIHIDFGVIKFHNLNGGFTYDPDQRWYYYPYQTEQEVLVFTQYSKDRFFCNPHSSFAAPNRPPPPYDARVSIEMRAAVFFPKDKLNGSQGIMSGSK